MLKFAKKKIEEWPYFEMKAGRQIKVKTLPIKWQHGNGKENSWALCDQISEI